ncbi:MAG: hypothetical protein KGJ80_07730 [Chloroflexota bacterium]|nr:hypothetical protein [Chloroflexota bacterium]
MPSCLVQQKKVRMTLKPPSNPLKADQSNTLREPISAPESIWKKTSATEWPDRHVGLVALSTASARLSAIIDWDALLRVRKRQSAPPWRGDSPRMHSS